MRRRPARQHAVPPFSLQTPPSYLTLAHAQANKAAARLQRLRSIFGKIFKRGLATSGRRREEARTSPTASDGSNNHPSETTSGRGRTPWIHMWAFSCPDEDVRLSVPELPNETGKPKLGRAKLVVRGPSPLPATPDVHGEAERTGGPQHANTHRTVTQPHKSNRPFNCENPPDNLPS